MTAVLEAETLRLAEQAKLDERKTAKERNQWGQFATPPLLALDMARYAWNKLKRRKGNFAFLDPAIGTGSFFAAFLQAFPQERVEAARGVELDKAFADAARAIWKRQGLQVTQGDFTRQPPERQFNVVLANPPYVRHHHLSAEDKRRLSDRVDALTGLRLSGLSGLYCYFLLIAHAWLADGALAAWLIPSEFMDVNYGEGVKRYLTERVSLLQIHRFSPSDVQFGDALVSSAIVVFENRKPADDARVLLSFGGTLTHPASSVDLGLERMRAAKKWTSLSQGTRRGAVPNHVSLGDLFTIKRGLATGNNHFFIVPKAQLAELGIPTACVRPILPSPRFVTQEIIEADADGWPALDRQLALIDCGLSEEEIERRWPRFAGYLAEGKRQGLHEGYLTSRRRPWYSQEKRPPAPFVCTYMGRSRQRPFRFIWNRSRATAANVYHMLYPKDAIARRVAEKAEEVLAALRAIRPEHFFSEGRVYGGGLHKMEPAEMMRLPGDEIAAILGVRPSRQRSLF